MSYARFEIKVPPYSVCRSYGGAFFRVTVVINFKTKLSFDFHPSPRWLDSRLHSHASAEELYHYILFIHFSSIVF